MVFPSMGRAVVLKSSTAGAKKTCSMASGFWKGGSGSVTNSKALKNGLCGIVAMGVQGVSTAREPHLQHLLE